MTRRKFCFLFGAGIGALKLGIVPSLPETPRTVVEDVARMFRVPVNMIMTQTSCAFSFENWDKYAIKYAIKQVGPISLSGVWDTK